MNFVIGDWVSGNTTESELIHGFIESINLNQDTVDIHVTQSDHETAIGRSVEISKLAVKKLTEHSLSEMEIRNLIDLALMTKDEEWFSELSEQLLMTLKKNEQSKAAWIPSVFTPNRLGRV